MLTACGISELLAPELSEQVRQELTDLTNQLWPDSSALSLYCKAVAERCLGKESGFFIDADKGVRYVDFCRFAPERALLLAAADGSSMYPGKPSVIARLLLPAALFHVHQYDRLDMAIGLRVAALRKAAQVRPAFRA